MKKIFGSKVLYSFAGLLLVIIGAINATIGQVAGGGACFAAGLILIVLFHFDVKKFNLFGLAAELREKIHEADMILEKLRGISLPISEIAVIAASQTGRYDSTTPKKILHDNVMAISNELRGMDVPNDHIEKIRDSWYFVTAVDMSLPIRQKILSVIDKRYSQLSKKNGLINTGKVSLTDVEMEMFDKSFTDIQVDRHEFIEESQWLNPDYKNYPSYFIGIIQGLKAISDEDKRNLLNEIDEHILDLNYLIQQKGIRRPEVWFK